MSNLQPYPRKIEEIETIAKSLQVESIAEQAYKLPQFAEWSACVNEKHHFGFAGLQHHTWEVITIARREAEFLKTLGYRLDDRVIFLSCLFHDIGKIWDYYPTTDGKTDWASTSHKRLIHHISRSGIEWSKAVERTGECRDIEEHVLHCILSHHGLREWGSPVFPKTREAWLLHLSDSISARMNDCDKVDLVHSV